MSDDPETKLAMHMVVCYCDHDHLEAVERDGERKGRALQAGEEWQLINDALRDFLADKKNGPLSVNDVLELYGILMEKGKRS